MLHKLGRRSLVFLAWTLKHDPMVRLPPCSMFCHCYYLSCGYSFSNRFRQWHNSSFTGNSVCLVFYDCLSVAVCLADCLLVATCLQQCMCQRDKRGAKFWNSHANPVFETGILVCYAVTCKMTVL